MEMSCKICQTMRKMKIVLRAKLLVLSAYSKKKKLERSHINIFMGYLKVLEQQKETIQKNE